MRSGGAMTGYLATPKGPSLGAVIAIMEIWGVNATMRHHAHEFADAGFSCLVPDLFWRQQPDVDLDERDESDVHRALELYYAFDYDLGVEDMEDAQAYLQGRDGGSVGAVGYCLGGKLCYLMCCRTDIACAVAYYGTYIEHSIGEAVNLHRPLMLHVAGKDFIVPPLVSNFVLSKLAPNPLVEIHRYPDADHAFARIGGRPYRADDAALALTRSIAFLKEHLVSA